MLKKLLYSLMATIVGLTALTACGGDTGSSSSGSSSSSSSSSTASLSSEDRSESETSSDAEETESSEDEEKEETDSTAMQIVEEMKIGWNLGNALDSVGGDETTWGNPVITEELIKGVKAAGFNTIRIPVTWIDHTGAAPDYTINEEWMNRVQEVVDYAIDNDMYAIINIHHDGMDYGQSWLTPEPTDKEDMYNRYEKLWTQISEHFKDYSDNLIFESMNEFHKGYDKPKDEYNTIINELNQKFIDIVRASGGNNAERYVILPGYNTNIEYTVSGFIMPEDTIEDHIIVSAHFYDPYTTALEGKFKQWGQFATDKVDNWGQEDWVEQVFTMLKEEYIDNDIPVVIGEFGATGGVEKTYRAYYDEYVAKTASDMGIVTIIWDNGFDSDGKEAFGIFDRATGENLHPEITEALMRAVSGEDYEVELITE